MEPATRPPTSPRLSPRAVGAFLGALTAIGHLWTAADGWDLFRDELYYVANSHHLGLGYVDHPPLVGWLTALARSLFGSSQLALRCLPALAGGATVYAVSRIAAALAGATQPVTGEPSRSVLWATLLAGSATALAPVYIGTFGYLSMNAFDTLFWVLCVGALFRILAGGDPRWWLAFGALSGLGLENKISVLFLGFGVAVGLLLTPARRQLRTRWPWFGGGLALLLFTPHLAWQVANGWPTPEFIHNATEHKNLPVAPLDFLAAQLEGMGYPATAVAVAGLAFLLFAPRAARFRSLGWIPVAIFALLVVQRSKPYYFAPAWGLLFAAGGVALASARPRWRWLAPVLLALLVAFGLLAAPLAKPLLGVDATVAYMQRLGEEAGTDERKEIGRLPQFFADRLGWRELALTVSEVYAALPAAERPAACAFGQNYGQAGAIDFYRGEMELPPAISGHNSYWLWGPGPCTGEVVIVIDGDGDDLAAQFESATYVTTYRCADCMPYEAEKEIWVARKLRLPLDQVWPHVKHYD
jgi:hypothetical protein